MARMTVPGILNATADKLAPAGAWTQGAYARRADGASTDWTDRRAVCWCVRGALYVVGGWRDLERVYAAQAALDVFLGGYSGGWNDHPARTQADVVAALRAAAVVAA